MVVWRDHKFPNGAQIEFMKSKAHSLFPDKKFDFQMRAIPDHFHFHLR